MIRATIRDASIVTKAGIALLILMLAGCSGGTRQIRLNEVGLKNRLVKVIIDDWRVGDSKAGSALVKKLEEKFALSFEKVSLRTGYVVESAVDEEMVIVPRHVGYQDMPDTAKGALFYAGAQVSSGIDVLIDNNWVHYAETGHGNSEGGDVLAILTFPTILVWGFLSEPMHKASAFNSAIEDTAIGLHNQILSSVEFQTYAEAVKSGTTALVKSKTPPSELIMTVNFSDDKGDNPNNILDAGENAEIVVNVKNNGKGTAFESKLEVASDNPKIIMMDREIKIGDIQAGETKEIKVSLRAALDTGMGKASFKLALRESRGYDAEKVTIDVPTVNEKILPSDLAMTARFSDSNGYTPNNILDAGENAELVISVKNNGKGIGVETTLDVRLDNPKIILDREIKVGDIQAGETKEIKIKLDARLDIDTGKESFQLTLRERRGYDAKKVIINIPTAKLERPQLEIVSTEIKDGDTGLAKGNGNGIPESGETVELTALIRNDGVGKAIGVNFNGQGITSGVEWVRDSALIGTIQPGETAKAKVAFTIPRNFDAKEIATTFKTSDSRGVSNVEKRVALTYAKQSPDIQYAYRILSKDTPVTTITNGEGYEIELTLNNKGKIPARGVAVYLSTGTGLKLSSSQIDVGDIKDNASLPGRRIAFSVPRAYANTQAPINIEISQSEFPPTKGSIKIPVDIKGPRMRYVAALQSKNGGNVLEQGENSTLEIQVLNEGTLPAEGVRIKIESRDDALKISGSTEEAIGKIPANSKSETIKFQLSTFRRITTGDKNLAINITQSDFNPVNLLYAINIREEWATVVDVSADNIKPSSSGAKKKAGPVINLKTAEISEPVTEKSFRLAFDVIDGIKNIDSVTIKVNDVVIPLGASAGLTMQSSKEKAIVAEIPLDFGPNRVTITARNSDNAVVSRELTVTRMAEEDVDTPKVATAMNNPDAVGVVIGISKYKNKEIPGVDYAQRDAAVMKEYMVKTLGYKEEKIVELYDNDATLPDVRSILTTKLMRKGKGKDIFVFFSGHGTHDPDSKEAYLIPYDFDPEETATRGFPVNELYRALEEIKDAKSITVVLDACFSGFSGDGKPLIKGVSAITFDVTNPLLRLKNARVFTSSQKNEYSNWYPEKRHGLFTYYFLQGLRGTADRNNDGQVTIKEMEEYLVKNVPEQAMFLHSRIQVPAVIADRDAVLVRYK